MDSKKNIEKALEILKSGKKLTLKTRNFKYSYNAPVIKIEYLDNNCTYKDGKSIFFNEIEIKEFNKMKSVRIVGSGYEMLEIKYVKINPQFNNTTAVLFDGREFGYKIDLLDLYWNEPVEYVEPKESNFSEAFKAFISGSEVVSVVSNVKYQKNGKQITESKESEVNGRWLVMQ